jgi:hypothetical protein
MMRASKLDIDEMKRGQSTIMSTIARIAGLIPPLLMLVTAAFVTLTGVFGPVLVTLLAALDP